MSPLECLSQIKTFEFDMQFHFLIKFTHKSQELTNQKSRSVFERNLSLFLLLVLFFSLTCNHTLHCNQHCTVNGVTL